MKWVEIAGSPSREYYEELSRSLKEVGLENQVDFIESGMMDFPEALKKAMEEYDAIRIGSPFKSAGVAQFKNLSALLRQLNSADCLVKIKGVWWPRPAGYHSFQRILSRVGSSLDLKSSVLIVGAGAGARFAIAALIKIGFKHFNLTNKFDEQALELIKELRQIYFDVEFDFIPQGRLVLLPGANGVVINTTPLTPTNDLLNELYYFNFLKSSGIAIDFTVVPYDTPFIKEAEAIGINTVRGYEVAAEADCVWVGWVFGRELDVEAYRERLKEKVMSIDFDYSPYEGAGE